MLASVGESLIDIIGGEGHVGGCPLNVAVAASRLGGTVTYFGKISSDNYGHQIMEKLINNGVVFDPQLCNSPYPTLCSVADVDQDFDYEGTAACQVTEAELSRAFSNEDDIDMVFFGSISMLMEPVCNAIIPAIHSIETRPKLFFDPNIRADIVEDTEAFRERIFSIVPWCNVVKASEEDIAFLYPDMDLDQAEKRFSSLCEWNLIVTRGSRGSTWYSKYFRIDSEPYKVGKIVDTVGCGDTFSAAIIVYLQDHDLVKDVDDLDKKSIAEALAFANKAAALNCLKSGCVPPLRAEMNSAEMNSSEI